MVLLIPILEILFKSEENLTTLLNNPPITDFWADGYDLQDHGFYYLAQQVQSQGAETVLLYVCIFIVIAILLKNLCTYMALYVIATLRNGVIRDYRNVIFKKILNLQLSYYSDERKGDIMSKVTNDLKEIEWSILRSVEAIFRDPITIIAYFIVLIWMSPQLTLFLAVFFPVAGLLIGIIGKSLRRSAKKGQSKLGSLMSTLEETLSGLRIIKGFNAKQRVYDKYEEQNEDYTKTMVKMYRKGDMASPVSEFLGVALIATVLWFGGQLVFEGALVGSFFIAYIAFLSQLISPFKSITNAYSNAQRGLSALERITDITDAEVTIVDGTTEKIETFNSHVHYQNISFKYDQEYVLKNIDLKLEKGKTIALVGQSGSGKTTMADLLPRFYDVDKGAILIDGIDIKNASLHDVRSLMGIVTQHSILFNDSVHNNIAFGKPDATREQVIEAANIANADEFIIQLEKGYDTGIGDGGGKLSGGQRQRISIARAVLKNPEILILDEATSALDTESEKLVQDALNNLMQNRTSLVIAHRLSTIQHADEIIVMQAGEIVERGNHSELISQGGVYKKLTDLQSFS
jgi:subfamily B ATP-binding cassette protein MsbA